MLEVGAFHPAWGKIHLGPENALTALERLGGGSFLPVHWGTFNLAIHAWDEPAETLLTLGPKRGAHLVMPTLGEPVEPSRAEAVTPGGGPPPPPRTPPLGRSPHCPKVRPATTRCPGRWTDARSTPARPLR